MRVVRTAVLLCLGALSCVRGYALQHEHQHPMEAPEQLGKVSFPTTCGPSSQARFERGVALLHSFGYEQAEAQFTEITRSDPGCAIAHWGVAMSLFHQIWDRPGEATLKRGQAEIAAAEKTGAKSARERSYISALGAFYRDPANKDYAGRVNAYSAAMGKLYQEYPADLEAGAFYALSLLASAAPGDLSLSSERKAAEVLNPLFQKQPDHPGLAHYLIHACDSPQLAPEALDAARRYAQIAPSSAHAVHMPAHIFARLGLWPEDIAANTKSVAMAHTASEAFMHGHELHAMHFLLYAYLQTGEDAAAKQMLAQEQAITAQAAAMNGSSGMVDYLGYAAVHFPALYHLEMHRWAEAAALEPPPGMPAHLQMITYWARTIGAARTGNAAAARASARKFDELEDATRRSKYAYMVEGKHFSRDEVHAWLAFAEKNNDAALEQMREVADRQDKAGKQEVDIPAREMLADMLLELKRPQQALAEYEGSMKTDPNRFNGLAGAGLAAESMHDAEKANSYFATLLKNCADGKNSERPELARAKLALAGQAQ